jgi:hypothetical protein
MDGHPLDNSIESVLLSWRMPVWTRRLFLLLPVAIVIPLVILVPDISSALSSTMPYWLFCIVVFLPMAVGVSAHFVCWSTAAEIIGTSAGIQIQPIRGRKISCGWHEVKSLQRSRLLGAIIVLGLSSFVFLRIPDEFMARLIAILREASNARIIGFD